MACEVKSFGKIRDFKKVQEYFGLAHDENWLNAINYAISPTAELIALGQGEKLALLSSSWDNKQQEITYALSWCGELEDPNQIITTLLCLPIYGSGCSNGPEWTCVALGLSSGMVVFYTDMGIKIFSQSYHDDAVLSIKCYTPPRYSESDSFVYIIYDQCVCICKGSDIFALLTNLRHNLNRTFSGRSATQAATADTLQFQKFKFARDRETIVNDAAVVAAQQRPVHASYDHIVEQCLGVGYYAKVNETAAQSSLVLGVGAEPYLGFYYAEEGYKTITLGEVAKDVIGMAYRNILGSWFKRPEAPVSGTAAAAGGGISPDEASAVPSKETLMRTRCRLYDGKRDGFTIAIAPTGHLAVVTDNLDRVMLVDTRRAMVLRVWKGYRDAQCAFVPVKEGKCKGFESKNRKSLFLVIYAPRMGCLEIWALQNGPKVAAFTVSKSGQLAYNTHGLLGVQPDSKVKAPISVCLFLDPSDSSVKEIEIPFHYALIKTDSSTSRDIHQLRVLKNLLHASDAIERGDEIAKIVAEFQTIEVCRQCLEILKKIKKLQPKTFQIIMDTFVKSLESQEAALSAEQVKFLCIIKKYKCLVDFYIAIQSPQEAEFEDNLELQDCDLVTINQLVLLLGNRSTTMDDSNSSSPPQRVVGFGGSATTTATTTVTFADQYKDYGDFIDYLSIFCVETEGDSIPLNRSKADSYGYISGKMFGEFFERGLCYEQFKAAAEDSRIPCEDLLILALYFWLEKPFEYQNCDEVISDMSRLAAMLSTICELAGDRVNAYDYNAISPWWQAVRELLLESPKSLGLLVAIVCKTVAANLRRSYREGSCDEHSQPETAERFELISQDEAEWGLLIGKLDDIAVLGAILEYPISSANPCMPTLPYEQPDCSLKCIVSGGKGIVTELTARWLIRSCIHPMKIVESNAESAQNTNEAEPPKLNCEEQTESQPPSIMEDINETEVSATTTATTDETETDPVLKKLALLREHFPFSLESGVLLSLMSWQYMVHWSKNLQNMEYFCATLDCLAQFKDADLALKHGICCMLWKATLKYPLQNTMKLIQKVGRLPVDKMCQQDLDMTASIVPDFLQLSLEFLEHFTSSLDHDKRELKFEESLADGPRPLQFIALQQHNALSELLRLHYELCTVLQFIAAFQLKVHKPITSLFDAVSNKAFFDDMSDMKTYVLTSPDIVLQQLREDFLCRVISASVDTIIEDLQELYVVPHVKCMERINALADSWKLNKAGLRRRQCVEMYAHGYDAHAEALLKDIIEDEAIGPLLLEIAGRRLSLIADCSQSLYMKVASVGHQLLHYMDNLKETSAKSIEITATEPQNINIDALSKLVTNTYVCLSQRESRYMHVAAQMFDALNLIQE